MRLKILLFLAAPWGQLFLVLRIKILTRGGIAPPPAKNSCAKHCFLYLGGAGQFYLQAPKKIIFVGCETPAIFMWLVFSSFALGACGGPTFSILRTGHFGKLRAVKNILIFISKKLTLAVPCGPKFCYFWLRRRASFFLFL